ncbi:major facilitator superfamily domain-containing protein [Kockovaella imperatae]|uniref:Lysosomal dipeptide transporter MFSD1 n=1 Tax=Kockovaella imperatae TaxID=4999 RepID=A0A1Y1U9F1_9TREE|nr:major facilitator superfamily domain-containing protein [Kockovaella imperatae]ORX34136.1 major facilitator superfamily domain-containing protein [Kockovaella imperatae]
MLISVKSSLETTVSSGAADESKESKSDIGNEIHLQPSILDTEQLQPQAQEIPLRYRLLAVSMILLFATGSSFAEAALSPLKATMIEELGINNAQYGAISSASSLVNSILPIIGGIGMDHWGATYAAILSSVFVLLGAVISAPAANTGNYELLIAGRVIMGLGSTVIESTQNKLYAHWFQGSWLACVFGVDIAWNRITGIIAKVTAVPMSNINGWWGWSLWIPAILCASNLGWVMLYWWFERSIPVQYRPPLGRDASKSENWRQRRFGLKTLYRLPMFFWVFCGSQVLQNGAVNVYTSNLADIQTRTRGTSKLAAGYNSSLSGIIPIVLTPLVGAFFDRWGWRMIIVSWTAILYITVFILIGLTKVHPLCPILISSFALSSGALPFLASIPILVGDDALLGTAFGVWKAFQNTNSVLLEVAAGAIQDRSQDNSYNNVIYLIVAIKCLEVILGPVYDVLDGRWLGHSLRMPEKKRIRFRTDIKAQGDPLIGWRSDRTAFTIVIAELSVAIVAAWVVSPNHESVRHASDILPGLHRVFHATIAVFQYSRIISGNQHADRGEEGSIRDQDVLFLELC